MIAWYISFSSCVLGGALGLMALNRWVKSGGEDESEDERRKNGR